MWERCSPVPRRVRRSPVPTAFHLPLHQIINGHHHQIQKPVFPVSGGDDRAPRVLVDVVLQNAVQFGDHVMVNVADAFGHEAEVGGLPPVEEVEGGVEELAAEVGGAWGAPGGVVGEEATAEAAEDGGVEGVDGVGRRIWALARWRTRCFRWLRTLSHWNPKKMPSQSRRCFRERDVCFRAYVNCEV
ncbi:hypothetical protein Syun_006473 [Stephania yunnanensis]|uniref:Uncharacterized protein n=1 Tax=Stephania yunnanensis TaxID=152371 RepID=A0AAP0PXK8_9MAGN